MSFELRYQLAAGYCCNNCSARAFAETSSRLPSLAAAVGSGHSFAATRLDAQRSIAGWIGEQTGGLSYLESIRKLADQGLVDHEKYGAVTLTERGRRAAVRVR